MCRLRPGPVPNGGRLHRIEATEDERIVVEAAVKIKVRPASFPHA